MIDVLIPWRNAPKNILQPQGHNGCRGGNNQMMLDAFATYERALISMRTKSVLAAKKARGERTGSVPYGYRLGKDKVSLVPDPDEQAAVSLAKELKGQGLTLRAIAAELGARGHKPRGGGAWHHQTVANILREG